MVKTSKDLTKQEHLEMYELMHLIRDFDMELSKLYSRGLVHGMTHYSVGEEAANVGAIYPLRKEDLMFSNHRGHGQTIAKGIEIDRMMAEILGKETGQCKGRGGSMHVYDLEQGNMGCNGIVGGGHGLSTGAALAQKMKKTDDEDEITLTLVKNPDILKQLGSLKKEGQIVIGFAAETHQVIEFAKQKLVKKNADFIIANDVSDQSIGFGADMHQVTILSKNGEEILLPKVSKNLLAKEIWQNLIQYL